MSMPLHLRRCWCTISLQPLLLHPTTLTAFALSAPSLLWIDSIAMDMKEKKLTVIGTVDLVNIMSKLRKYWPAYIILVGPAKEPEKPKEEPKKKEEAKKEEPKKEEPKKEEPKKEEEKKEEEKKQEAAPAPAPAPAPIPPPDLVLELIKAYKAYNPYLTTHYHVQSIEENPNACVIC